MSKQCKDLSNQRFGKLLVLKRNIEYEKQLKYPRPYWECQCDCGKIVTVRGQRLISGRTTSCGCYVSEHNRKDYVGKTFGKLTVIEYLRSNKRRMGLWRCKCECGNEVIRQTQNLQEGSFSSCGCSNISKGANKIYTLLIDGNIPFETEKYFTTCKFPDTQRYAYFDFYVDNKFLLEYDGEQHFSSSGENGWNTIANFHKTQSRDLFKNQWCKQNNIPLKRIPYWMIDTITLEDLLGDKYLIT